MPHVSAAGPNRPLPRRLTPRMIGAPVTALLLLTLLPITTFAAPSAIPAADLLYRSRSFTFVEESFQETNDNRVYDGSGIYDPSLDNTYVVSDTCDDRGFTTSYWISGDDAYMKVSGTVHSPTTCSYVVHWDISNKDDEQWTFNITVNNVNENPTNISLSSNSVDENLASGTKVGTLTSTDPDVAEGIAQTFTYSLRPVDDYQSFSISGDDLNTAASFNYETKNSYNVTVRTTDQGGKTFDKSLAINVNDVAEAPVITEGASVTVTMSEDGSPTPFAKTLHATDEDAVSTLTWSVPTQASYGTATASGTGTSKAIAYSPIGDYNGSDSFVVRVSDGGLNDDITVNVTINAVNDEPSFAKGANQTIDEDAGLISRGGWATGVSPGPANESGQTLTFHASNDNNALFSQQPAIASDGTLTYRPANDAHGSATVSVYLQDSGGTANGGDDTSATETFDITVSPVNDAPVLDSSGSPTVTAIDEDAADNAGMLVTDLLATGAGGDPIDDVDDNAAEGIGVGIAVIGVNNDNGAWQYSTNGGGTWTAFGAPSPTAARLLAADAGTKVRFVPNANWNGDVYSALTFRAWDQKPGSGANGGTADIGSLGTGGTTPFSADSELATLTVNPVNDAPILDDSGDMALDPILEDPPTNNGTSVVAIIESAGGNRITEVPYEVAPVEGLAIVAADNSHGDWQFTTGAQWIDFGAPSENSARLLAATTATKVRFVPDEHWSMNWSDAIAPSITFRAWDQTDGSNGGTADAGSNGGITPFSTVTETAIITVTSLNDPPFFTKGEDQVLDEDAPAQTIANWATAISPGPDDEVANGQSVAFSIIYNTAPGLFDDPPAINPVGQLTYTPMADAYGAATIIFKLQDNGGTLGGGDDSSEYEFFSITLNGVNDAPSFTAGADQAVDEDSGTHTIDGWAGDISRGPDNEDWQDLDFIVSAANPGLFSAGPAISASGQLSYTLAANANGTSSVTVHLHDGGGTQFGGINVSDVHTFTITVNPLNDPPVNTAAPQISGLPFVNDILTVTPGTWNDDTDLDPGTISIAYQWQRADNETGTNLTNIGAATASSHTVTLADAGKYLRACVTASDDGEGTPASQSSVAFSAYVRIGVVNTDITLSDFTRSTDEDVSFAFNSSDFAGHYAHDHDQPMERIRITALPTRGALLIGAAAVSLGQEITATLLNQLVYTPTANWNGADTFRWNASNDAFGAGYPLPGIGAAVTVTVQAVNDAPVITTPGDFSVSEGTPSAAKTFSVTDVDTPFVASPYAGYEFSLSASSGVITIATTTGLTLVEGGNGSAAMDYTGTLSAINAALNGIVYLANEGYTGLDMLEISVSDHGSAGSGAAQADAQAVGVFVVEVNNAPVNNLPGGFMYERGLPYVPLPMGVQDDARAPIQFSLSCDVGTLSLGTTSNLTLLSGNNGSSQMTYRGMPARVNAALATTRFAAPNDYHGHVVVTLHTNDLGNTGGGGPLADTDAMTITVNATPLVAQDVLTSYVNVPLIVPAPGVLVNDSDADGDGLTVTLHSMPAHGTVTLSPDGAFVFTPTLNYKGTDTFSYRAGDTITHSLPASVTIRLDKGIPTVAVAAAPTTALPGQTVALTSTVTGFPGGATPSGGITFHADGHGISQATLATGVGVSVASTLPVGTHIITVTYHGDDNYGVAQSLLGVTIDITDTLAAGHTLSGGAITGTITNNGTLENTTIQTGSTVIGGVISGTTTNGGTLVDVTINPQAIIGGGTISGTVTNGGVLSHVTVYSGATVTGGTVTGGISNFGTLCDVNVFTGTQVIGGSYCGSVINHGLLTGFTSLPSSEIKGGTVSGQIDNQGTLNATTILTGSSVTGGTLSGETANGGTITDAHLATGAIISGGTISGEIAGSNDGPALLKHLDVACGSALSHVVLGPHVNVCADVSIGDGVLSMLVVNATGRNGTVVGESAGVNCTGGTCDYALTYDSYITLAASGVGGEVGEFMFWRGDCSGREDHCDLRLDQYKEVTASFVGATVLFPFVSRDER